MMTRLAGLAGGRWGRSFGLRRKVRLVRGFLNGTLAGELCMYEQVPRVDGQAARDTLHEMARQFETRFVPERARRCPILLPEGAAEIRSVVETPAEAENNKKKQNI